MSPRGRAFGVAVVVAALLTVTPSAGADDFGDLTFPADEHAKVDGLDYWWGAADVTTTEGNHYTISMAYTGFSAYAVAGHQMYAHQGPYEGMTILNQAGPAEWGHPDQLPGEFLTTLSVHVPGVSDLLALQTLSLLEGGKVIDRFERTTLDESSYRFTIDNDTAEVHPAGSRVRWAVDLDISMHEGPPLLAGGTGGWWYGIPETFGYPSRSFQYMQASCSISGTIELEQPDGTVTVETIDPTRSNFVMIHEYDATPEDIPAGLLLAQATQLHPHYAQYYQGGMPWEITFVDLRNGAQIMLVVMAFHYTEEGTLADIIEPDQPTYRILATLRLPTGESVALGDDLHVEHLSYREIVGRVPTAFVAVWGHMLQAWETRIGHPGGTALAGDGSVVDIPPFDLGLVPQIDPRMPAIDDDGNGLTQRVPFRATGHWDGCPVTGAGWSELIINWFGRTDKDPWYTGGTLPDLPDACGPTSTDDWGQVTRPLTPTPDPPGDLVLAGEGCQAIGPAQPTCTYTATTDGGIGGFASDPGGWTVTIDRPGRDTPVVVNGTSGVSFYACGIIQPGDVVTATAREGSGVMPGNPDLCTTGNALGDRDVRILAGPTTSPVTAATARTLPVAAAGPCAPVPVSQPVDVGDPDADHRAPTPVSSSDRLPSTGGSGTLLIGLIGLCLAASFVHARRVD